MAPDAPRLGIADVGPSIPWTTPPTRPVGEVGAEVAEPPEPGLDVVAEDPQEQHVPEQVHPRAVEEHARERREERRVGGDVGVPLDDPVGLPRPLHQHEHEHVRDDQRVVDERGPSFVGFVADRDHGRRILPRRTRPPTPGSGRGPGARAGAPRERGRAARRASRHIP